jgi:hypothetical protein
VCSSVQDATSQASTWTDEELAKCATGHAGLDFLSSAQNMKEVAAIDGGKQRGEARVEGFNEAWKMADGHHLE